MAQVCLPEILHNMLDNFNQQDEFSLFKLCPVFSYQIVIYFHTFREKNVDNPKHNYFLNH